MTGRRIAWAVWLIAAAALWLFENNAATLTLLLASLLLPCLSILLAVRTAKRAHIRISAPECAAKQARVQLTFEANAHLMGTLVCENPLCGETAQLSLRWVPPQLTLSASHCGTLHLHVAAFVEDIFGLWRSKSLPCAEEYVSVLPALFLSQITQTENTTVISDSEQYSQTKPGSDPSETFAIREYLPSDPIRQIHWKLSQKSDQLMMRELGLPVVNQTLLVFRNVLLPGTLVSPETADAMAEVFLSVSRALITDGYVHTAAFAEHGQYLLTEVRNEVDFHAMRSRFLALSWEAEDGALARLVSETPYAHVAVVSAVMPPDAASFCRGNRVTVLTPEAAEQAAGVFAVPFTEENYPNELQRIEL